MDEPPEQQIIHSLKPFVWSDDAAINYEITVEMMARVVGLYSNLARRPETSSKDVSFYRSEMARWAEVRLTLRVDDAEAVDAVRRECAEIINRLGAMQ